MQEIKNKKRFRELLFMLHESFLDINKGLNNFNTIEISMMIESVEQDMKVFSFSQDERQLLELYINLSKMCLEFFQIIQIMDNIIANYQDSFECEIFSSMHSLLDSFSESIEKFKRINSNTHYFDKYFQTINKKVEKYYEYISQERHFNRHLIKK